MALIFPISGGFEDDLNSLGLPYACLTQALGASNRARRSCNRHAAPTAGGYYAYNGLVTSLSEQLHGDVWRRINANKVLPLLVNHERQIVLGVTSGDAMTGTRIGQPRSRYPKGELTKSLVSKNRPANQPGLFEEDGPKDEVDKLDGYSYWLNLVYYDKVTFEIRSEVSLPKDQNARGYVAEWYHRIILPPYQVEEIADGDDPNAGFGPIDVPVEPR